MRVRDYLTCWNISEMICVSSRTVPHVDSLFQTRLFENEGEQLREE